MSAASLRISGKTLIPAEVSRILGCRPTESYARGDEIPSRLSHSIRWIGLWRLNSEDRTPGNLDAQIEDIFGRLNDDLDAWANVSAQFKMELVCGLVMDVSDEEVTISRGTIKLLEDRGIEVVFASTLKGGKKTCRVEAFGRSTRLDVGQQSPRSLGCLVLIPVKVVFSFRIGGASVSRVWVVEELAVEDG